MIADDIVDIFLESDEDEMSRFIRDALFKMNWKRKPFAGSPDDPIAGEYRLEFDTAQGYSGSVAFTLHTTYHKKLHGNVSVTVVVGEERSVSTRWRIFEIKQVQIEKFRAAWQKFVREQIPLTITNGVPSKMKLVAQISKVLKQFRLAPAQKANPAAVKALQDFLEKADIPEWELTAAVEEQEALENGHTSDYSIMTPDDVAFWMNWAKEHGTTE